MTRIQKGEWVSKILYNKYVATPKKTTKNLLNLKSQTRQEDYNIECSLLLNKMKKVYQLTKGALHSRNFDFTEENIVCLL